MVKKFSTKNLKPKFPISSSKKKDDDQQPTTSNNSGAGGMSGARAEYYASRNNASVGVIGGSGSSNPFGEPSSSRNNNTNPFGGGGQQANPFEDSSSDDDNNDALAGFANKKKPPPPVPVSSSSRQLPPQQQQAMPSSRNNLTKSMQSTTSNPFGDDSDDDNVPPPRPSNGGSQKMKRANSNPFGDDDEEDTPKPTQSQTQSRSNMRSSLKKSTSVRNKPPSSSNNPFGDDDNSPPQRKSVRASSNNPFGDEEADDNNDPFSKEMSNKKPPQFSKNNGASTRRSMTTQPNNTKSNPFDDDSTAAAPSVPKPLISQQQPSRQKPVPTQQQTRSAPPSNSNNPFGDGPSTTTDSRGRQPKRYSAVAPNNGGEEAPMDEEGSSNAAGLASWLRLNKKEDSDVPPGSGGGGGFNPDAYNSTAINAPRPIPNSISNNNNTSSNNNETRKKKVKTKRKNKAHIIAWPFDNYHEVQQNQYEELASRADYSSVSADNNMQQYNVSPDKKDTKRSSQRGTSGAAATDSSKYYERPDELPSIKEAVNDLSLVDFEKKAEERAINIVSTWLFDAGLIDELLVNGAMGPAIQQQQQQQQQQKKNISSANTVMTEKTSEGQELGVNGFLVGAEGAEMKMDKESNKLRAMIQRDLSIINARLNDGVAASGLEVQELVNAVSATQDDIGRLRELTTYISDGQISDRNEFLLAKYPYLRKAINARRNINRCFRELDFFSHIPSTCERLRDDLHGGEWTAEEWSTIRNVSMEHVELEVMLVEAESSMKGGAHNFNSALVDNFLNSHVQNVWELGDEIRMRIISGIGSAFELSMNNPAGMVALVEAVEVYERAAETFEKKRNDSHDDEDGGERLRFTNMRAAALEQLYQDFELRGVDMFRGVHEHAADVAEEDDASNTQFTAVLKAATELVTEIDIVKHQMSPCFAPHWHVEALWSSCVAHVCSNHIVQQIGGPDGQNLPELTITQLLELVAWVEYFRETIEETFPEVSSMRDTKKTYFEERPELFAGDKRTVNMQNAKDSLAWVNNMLWEVHRLAQEEFLVRTRSQTDEWLDKVYGSESVKNQSAEGKLTTSLCEDVFSFSSVQLRTIRERLSKKSDALILAVCIILSHMRSTQIHARNNFLQDLETCCAASNDFTRMSEKCEDMISELMSQCEFSVDMIETVEVTSNELMGVYSSDAVYSARSVHIYVFDPIEEEIGIRLFEEDWEETMVDNDLAISLVRTLEDFHEDLEQYMDDFMVVKSVMSLMSATVIFYAKCLLQRAERHRNNKRPYFGDVKTALDRMTGDIKVMRAYFEGLVPQMPSLRKNIEKDFEILATIHELMSIAAGFSVSDAEDFILVLQKRVRDVGITKHIVGDLWHLVAPTEERYVWELVESLEEQLVAIAPVDDALALEVNDRSYVKGLRLDEMAVKLYVKSRRNRPIKATAVESIVKNWKTTWVEEDMNTNEEE